MKNLSRTAACVLLAGSSAFNVAHAGVIVGAAVGKSSSSSSGIEDDSARKYYVGYELSSAPVFFELSMKDSGDMKLTGTNAWVSVEVTQLGVGWQLVSEAGSGVFVKAGYFDADSTVTGPFPSEKDSNTGFGYGLGGTWMFMPKLGLRVEWEKVPGVEHALLNDQDVSFTMAGVVFKFGK